MSKKLFVGAAVLLAALIGRPRVALAACMSDDDCPNGGSCVLARCVAQDGSPCTTNQQCRSNTCSAGVCITPAPSGSPCSNGEECQSDICSAGVCIARTEMLLSSGPSANRVDLVIMGDGYRSGDQAKLTADAKTLMNTFFAQPMYAAYKNYYNVKLVHVVSNQDGADNGSLGQLRDTALGAFYDCFGIDRLLCVDDNAVLSLAAHHAPEFDKILVVVNDTKYGGSGGAQIATASLAPGAPSIPVHELGHSLFGLADEYVEAGHAHCDSTLDCPEPNASVFSQASQIKWNRWIDASTPVPTPDSSDFDGVVGAFPGARYFSDQFRPARNCIMRSLGANFCPVCQEAGVLTTYTFVDPIDQVTPPGAVNLIPTQSQDFVVQGPRPNPDTMNFVFSIDGTPVAVNQTGSFSLAGSTLGNGSHTLDVRVTDLTSFVRRDDGQLLESSFSWPVTVSTPACSFSPARPGSPVTLGALAALGVAFGLRRRRG